MPLIGRAVFGRVICVTIEQSYIRGCTIARWLRKSLFTQWHGGHGLPVPASATLLLVKSGSVCQGNHPTTTDNLPKAASKKLRYDLLPNFHRVDLGAPPSADATCMLWQECKGRQGFFGRDMKTTTCRTDGGAP